MSGNLKLRPAEPNLAYGRNGRLPQVAAIT
jgi:hypothetical protein